MLGWDDSIPSRDGNSQNRVVGLFTLKDKAGCGRGNALRVCSSVQFEKQSHKKVIIFVFFMSNDLPLLLLHTLIVQVMEHEQFSTPKFTNDAQHQRISVLLHAAKSLFYRSCPSSYGSVKSANRLVKNCIIRLYISVIQLLCFLPKPFFVPI